MNYFSTLISLSVLVISCLAQNFGQNQRPGGNWDLDKVNNRFNQLGTPFNQGNINGPVMPAGPMGPGGPGPNGIDINQLLGGRRINHVRNGSQMGRRGHGGRRGNRMRGRQNRRG
uniref:Uncharacterized protein n=1 Tax=Acrobeloides nanus TaxID=290746 RepID=A0A914DVF4_9BILA